MFSKALLLFKGLREFMKKHSSASRKNVMKKKTKHKIKLDRIRRVKEMTTEAEPVNPSEEIGDPVLELKATQEQCLVLIRTAAEVGTMLRNKPLVAAVENKSELIRKATVFVKDVVEFKDRLNNITEKMNELDATEHTDERTLASLNVGQAFQEWIENYQNVVIPNQMDIAANLADAYQKLNTPPTTPEEIKENVE